MGVWADPASLSPRAGGSEVNLVRSYVLSRFSRCPTLCDPMDNSPPGSSVHGVYPPARLLCPWDSPGENTGVGCHALPQGIFPTQGSNLPLLCLLHWQALLYL